MKLSDGANQLREFLDSHGLSSRDIAKRLRPRTQYQAVVRWYNGKRYPSGDYRKQLTILTGIEENAWLAEDERRVADAKARWIAAHPENAAIRSDRPAPVYLPGRHPRGSVTVRKPGPKLGKKRVAAPSKASKKSPKNRPPLQAKTNGHSNHKRENSSGKSKVARDKGSDPASPPPARLKQPEVPKTNGSNHKEPAKVALAKAEPKPTPAPVLKRKSHSHCSSDDPMERIRNGRTRPDKYELVDKAGAILEVYSNVVDAKTNLDLRDPHVTATAVRCRDCLTIMAQRSKPAQESTEFLARSGI